MKLFISYLIKDKMYLVYVVFTVKFSITQFFIGPLVWIYNVISMYLYLLYICVKSLWSLTWQYIYIYGYRWQTAALLSAIGRLTVQRSLVPSSQGGLWTTESWPKAHCEVTCLLPLTKWESCQLLAKIWGKHWLRHPGRSEESTGYGTQVDP